VKLFKLEGDGKGDNERMWDLIEKNALYALPKSFQGRKKMESPGGGDVNLGRRQSVGEYTTRVPKLASPSLKTIREKTDEISWEEGKPLLGQGVRKSASSSGGGREALQLREV